MVPRADFGFGESNGATQCRALIDQGMPALGRRQLAGMILFLWGGCEVFGGRPV
jgi:hypothetical protein